MSSNDLQPTSECI